VGHKKEANGTLLFYNLWMSVPEAEGKNTVRFRKKDFKIGVNILGKYLGN